MKELRITSNNIYMRTHLFIFIFIVSKSREFMSSFSLSKIYFILFSFCLKNNPLCSLSSNNVFKNWAEEEN